MDQFYARKTLKHNSKNSLIIGNSHFRHLGHYGTTRSIYFNRFQLACSHDYCKACLRITAIDHFIATGKFALTVKCLICQKGTKITGDKKNSTYKYVLTKHKLHKAQKLRTTCTLCPMKSAAVAHCCDCAAFLCLKCNVSHQVVPRYKDHTILIFEDAKSSLVYQESCVESHICRIHTLEFTFFCDTCKTLICNMCLLITHKMQGHRTLKLEQSQKEVSKEISNNPLEVCSNHYELQIPTCIGKEKPHNQSYWSSMEVTKHSQMVFEDLVTDKGRKNVFSHNYSHLTYKENFLDFDSDSACSSSVDMQCLTKVPLGNRITTVFPRLFTQGYKGIMSINCVIDFSYKKGKSSSPRGICLGINDDIIVADTNNHRIQVYEKGGTFKFQFGSFNGRKYYFSFPRKVAVMKDSGNIIVSDREFARTRLQIFTKDGDYIRRLICRFAHTIAGLAVTSQNNIVALHSCPPQVRVVSEHGKFVSFFDFSRYIVEASAMAVCDEEFYLCDTRGHRVLVFNNVGQFMRCIVDEKSRFSPRGVTILHSKWVILGDTETLKFHMAVYSKEGGALLERVCPYVKLTRIRGMEVTADGYVIVLAKSFGIFYLFIFHL